MQSIVCCTYLPNGTFVTGTHAGELLFWNENVVITAAENLHTVSKKEKRKIISYSLLYLKKSIYSVFYEPSLGLITGGSDGYLILHDPKSLETIEKIQLEAGIKSVDVGKDGAILVGLEDSILLEIQDFGKNTKSKVYRIIEGHSNNK